MLLLVLRIDLHILGILDDMRNIIIAPVGYGRTQVGEMQRRASDLSLTDGQGDDSGRLPSALPVVLVVIFRIRDESPEFGREVAAELLAESEAHHIFPPFVQRIIDAFIFRILQQCPQYIAVIGIAGHHDGLLEIDGRLMLVASELVSSEMIAHAARVPCVRSENLFLESYETVHQLEHRSRGIRCLHSPVEHRLIWIGQYLIVMLSEICKHVHVYTGA